MENIWRDSSTIFSQKDYLLPLPEGNVLKTQFSSFKALTKLNWISSSYINNVPLELEKCFIYEHVFPFDLYGNLLCFVLIKIEWIKYIYTKKISSSLSLLLLLLLLSLQFLVHFSSIWLPMQKKEKKRRKKKSHSVQIKWMYWLFDTFVTMKNKLDTLRFPVWLADIFCSKSFCQCLPKSDIVFITLWICI